MKIPDNVIRRVLDGESMSAVAAEFNLHAMQVSRAVKKHPDYAKAVEEGKIRQKGFVSSTGDRADTPELRQAVEAVVNGELVTTVAARYGIPRSTLTKYLKRWHPGIVLRGANADPQRNAKAAIARAEGILKRAQERLA